MPPEDRKSTELRVLFKKGDKMLPENYRPIELLPVLCRLFSGMVLQRIGSGLEAAQAGDQATFRLGFMVLDHMFSLSIIVEKAGEFDVQ